MATKKKKTGNAPLIEIVKNKGSKGKILVGRNASVYYNGTRLGSCMDFKMSLNARGMAKVTLELCGNVSIRDEE